MTTLGLFCKDMTSCDSSEVAAQDADQEHEARIGHQDPVVEADGFVAADTIVGSMARGAGGPFSARSSDCRVVNRAS